MAEFSKSLDVNLAGVTTAGVPGSNADVGALHRAQRIMDALEGVKRLGDACERLSRRMDAWEGSAKGRTGYVPGLDVEAEDLRFQ
jgi:hypothetical protein